MMRFLIALTMLAISGQAISACPTAEARSTLKKWGFAYCLKTHYEAGHKLDSAAVALGGYFQLGSHNSEQAYDNVRQFVDERFNAMHKTSKQPGQNLAVMTCLDIYESREYRSMIVDQDRFIGGAFEDK
ncbi:MAG: hypothetical protein ACREPV_01505 [Lysobacter sp.]